MSFDWNTSPRDAVATFRNGGTYLDVATVLYDAGGGSVASLAADWKLGEADAAELMARVRKGWADGRWTDRRKNRSGRRRGDS